MLSWDALGTMTPGEDETGCRDGGLGRGRGGAKDPPKRLGKRSLEGTVCFVAKRAEDLHALRHKASADSYLWNCFATLLGGASFLLRYSCLFSPN